MSKEAAQRAMREARYARMVDRAAATTGAARTTGTTTGKTTGKATSRKPPAPVAPPAPAGDALCGHRSMNGRTCTREQGHTAKNHRYS